MNANTYTLQMGSVTTSMAFRKIAPNRSSEQSASKSIARQDCDFTKPTLSNVSTACDLVIPNEPEDDLLLSSGILNELFSEIRDSSPLDDWVKSLHDL